MQLNFLKKYKKYVVWSFFLFFFTISNCLFIILANYLSGNFYRELFGFFQFLLFLFLLSFIKIKEALKFLSFFFFYLVYVVLLFYRIYTLESLNFSFLKRNFNNIENIFEPYLVIFLMVSFFVFINTLTIFYVFKKLINSYKSFFSVLLILVISVFFFGLKNEFFLFTVSIYNSDKIINNYEEDIYKKMVYESIEASKGLSDNLKEIKGTDVPGHLENIIILQIESLNSFLLSTSTTPNFLKIAKEGVFFPAFYGNSIQTILGQENILCSLPSSFDSNLVKSAYDKDVLCLPQFFSELNYKTFFLKTFNLDFDSTGEFAHNIGFQEIHSADIMENDDPSYHWGYREDVFYKRAFEYLGENIADNNFIYLEVGPTNHWPFITPDDFDGDIPFKNPTNHQERLINTTYIQDSYLAEARKGVDVLFPEKNYTLIILGDHSWPAELHKNNYFNQNNSYEENFLTSMIVISGDDSIPGNKIVKRKYSQMDIMPTITEYFDYNYINSFRASFMEELGGGVNLKYENEILLIQPYGDRYLNRIREGRYKEQYNALKEEIYNFDLLLNPLEEKLDKISQYY